MLSFTTIDGRIYRTIKFSIFPIRLEFHLFSNTKGHCWKIPTLWWINQFGILLPRRARLHVKSVLQAMLSDVENWCDDFMAHTIFRGSPIFSPNCLQLTNLRIHSLANLVIYLGKLTKIFWFFYFYNTQTKREKRYQTQQSSSWLWTQWKTISCTYSFYTRWKPWDFLKVSTAFNIKNF